MTQPIPARRFPTWLIAAFCCASLYFIVHHLQVAARVWPRWRAGAPEMFPHAHALSLLGAASGVLMAILLPFPFLIASAAAWPRRRRWALWVTWGVLMAAAVVLDAYQGRLLR